MSYDYDLFVIGGGSGGLAAAKRAAKYGAKVAIAESHHLGGTCANLGCIPKKLMVFAADFAHWAEASVGYGWTPQTPQFSWQRFIENRDRYLESLRQSQRQTLEKLNVEIICGSAKLIDLHGVEVNDRKVTADKILIAVGGKPMKPDLPGIEYTITSDQMFHLKQLPKRLAIMGGGYIGVEFASVMRGLGVEVCLINREDHILSGFDRVIVTAIESAYVDRGIHIYSNTSIEKIESHDRTLAVTLTGNSSDVLTVDTILCAIGRAPNLENLGLEQVGVEMDKKSIFVDQFSRTNQPNIYAVGDCTNRKQLTPVARAEGKAFAQTVFGEKPCSIDYDSVPAAVCARPEGAMVGLTEAEAREQFGDIECAETTFKPLFHGLSGQDLKTTIKYVIDRSSDRILGIHMVGIDAAEILQGFALAFKKGITKHELDAAIGIHPSSAEEFFTMD